MLNGINRLDKEQKITEPEDTAIDTTQNGKKKKSNRLKKKEQCIPRNNFKRPEIHVTGNEEDKERV